TVGILCGVLRLKTVVENFIEDIRPGETGRAFLAQANGSFISDGSKSSFDDHHGHHQLILGLAQSKDQKDIYLDLSKEMFSVFKKTKEIDWYFGIEVSKDETLAIAHRVRTFIIIWGFFIVLAVCSVVFYFVNNFAQLVLRFTTAIELLSKEEGSLDSQA